MDSHLPTVITSSIASLLVIIAIIWLCKRLGNNDTTAIAYNLLICILGGLIGWILGALATPFDAIEGEKFILLGETAGVFLSGYVVSKLDRFLELSLFSGNGKDSESWGRIALFVSSCLVVAIFVFTVRDYLNFDHHQQIRRHPNSAVEMDAPQAASQLAPRPSP